MPAVQRNPGEKKLTVIIRCQWMNIHALLITVLIPNVHINSENELNEILRCISAAMPILGSVPDASRPR